MIISTEIKLSAFNRNGISSIEVLCEDSGSNLNVLSMTNILSDNNSAIETKIVNCDISKIVILRIDKIVKTGAVGITVKRVFPIAVLRRGIIGSFRVSGSNNQDLIDLVNFFCGYEVFKIV